MTLVKFDSLAGVPCYYARVNAGYGDLSRCAKTRVRQLELGFLSTMNTMVQELDWACHGTLGHLSAITSGGAWVPESAKRGPKDWHVQGKAFDLGGLHWESGHVLTCLDVAGATAERSQLLLYIAAEAVWRKHVGVVLGVHFNRAHHNHWHLDPHSPRGYRSPRAGVAKTWVRYLQEALTHVWEIDCGTPDGKEGPKTRWGMQELRRRGGCMGRLQELENWLQFLTLTAMRALQLRQTA